MIQARGRVDKIGTSYKGPSYKCLAITNTAPRLTQDPEEPYLIHISVADVPPDLKEGSRVTFELETKTSAPQNLATKH